VVVGAGPAGSITAAFLARQGHEVLLLDQDSFPRHKTCGEALPSGVMEILLKAGLVDLFAGCLHKNRILTRTLVNKFNRFTGYCCRLS